MKKYWIANTYGFGFLSNWMKSIGLINTITKSRKMIGAKNLSSKPNWQGWNGQDFNWFTIELSEKGLETLKPYIEQISDDEIKLSSIF
ncbi:hypothetical protein [Parabacteroides pacaensis]|uniref:hypothetical protein n=1 Tax=Parabacteroides pacaensis TaxID=2086575 RepID=UPI00131D8239|nr:hypothetical protein [Parabacteroides pacaensis]